MTRIVTDQELTDWLEYAQRVVNADYARFMPKRLDMTPTLRYSNIAANTKYIRIMACDDSRDQRSAWGFINLENGDVLKTDGWKKPALNFSRGNIYNADHGASRLKWTGVW